LDKCDLNKCIIDNINDNNSRYLLLEINSNLVPLINKNIRIQNQERKDIPFLDNNNNEYKIKKVYEIQICASQKDKLIILQNLELIHPYLSDLFKMNDKIIDGQKYARICLDNFSEYLTPISDSFGIIIIVDKKFINSVDMRFLNGFKKIKISFRDLLDTKQKELFDEILSEIRLKKKLKKNNQKLIMIYIIY